MSKIIYLNPQHLEKLSVYPTANGFITSARQRKATNWNSESYEKIRSHRKEFGRAASTAAGIRLGFKQIIDLVPDTTMYRRMSSKLLDIIKQDTTHIRGERTVEEGQITELAGFQFNQQANFYRVCNMPPKVMLDRQLGTAQVSFPAFTPAHELRIPKNATHVQFVAAVHAINFDENDVRTQCVKGDMFSLHQPLTQGVTLDLQFDAHEKRHLFVSVGVVFIEVLHGRPYKVAGGHQNAMCITHVFPKQAASAIEAVVPNVEVVADTTPLPTVKTTAKKGNRRIPSFLQQYRSSRQQRKQTVPVSHAIDHAAKNAPLLL
ncbi:hypothetical protein LX64_02516 [Chitinophaga skermanii]|uniref:Uncharacterized protein n=1 Tax=Chitinophaga skermanii TaxID=331697 RepID=A0A327QLD5_9BACT|nr:hypothetical protein [Chitinophaga skermanii]RAJ05359.1 hypothetical protein LX64_02516 [Chitinophaga skermanii]